MLLTDCQEISTRYTLRFWTGTYHDSASLEAGIRRKAWDAFEKRGIKLPIVREVWIHKQNPFTDNTDNDEQTPEQIA